MIQMTLFVPTAASVWLLLLLLSFFVSSSVQADQTWPNVPFPAWPKVTIQNVLQPIPLPLPSSTLGSVQPRKFVFNPLKDRPRCNRQMPDRSWIPDWCDWQLTRAD